MPASGPCRAVDLTAKALGVELNYKVLDLMKKEQLTPEFIKVNPQHTIPTIVDNGFSVWESRVILTYLVDQYGKDDSLFPKDPKKRAIVNQRLNFDLGTLYARFADYYYPVLFAGGSYDPEKLTKIQEAFKFLDTFLEGQEYAAGNTLTVADFSLVASVSSFDVMSFDMSPYKNVTRWYAKVKATAPGYEEINGKGMILFKEFVDSLMKNKMTIDFYYVPGSAPCRSVLLAAKAVGVDLNLKYLDLMKGEQLTPEFIKINPQHTVPTLVDNGFALWESRAIMTYLAEQYGKDDSLYPKDTKKRAVVDQRLYFDLGTLYARFADYYYPVIFGGASYEPEKLTKIQDAFKFLDTFLEGQDYVAGNTLTVADLSLVATVSTFEVMKFDMSPYKNVTKWYAKVKATAPGYEEANGKNVLIFKQMVDNLAKK